MIVLMKVHHLGGTLGGAAFTGFPGGAFFAVHDDQGVTAFDWKRVAEVLGLRSDS